MSRAHRFWGPLALCAILFAPESAGAATVFQLSLPLTSQPDTLNAVAPYGGTITGGSFGATGWTTTSRDDLILVPLPVGLDTSEGTLTFSVRGFEWNVTPDTWEQWALLGLDALGPPLVNTPTGRASAWTLYRGFNPDDATKGYHLAAYFNLYDPSCTDWHNCTAESKTPNFWLQQTGVTYTVTQSWSGPVDNVSFSGGNTVNRVMDLTATAGAGVLSEPQMYLMINACGGSTANACGPWDGPAALKGGPIGVTYANVSLEIIGPDQPDAGVQTDAAVPPDAGPQDAAAPDVGPQDAAAPDAAAPDGATPDASPMDAGAATDGAPPGPDTVGSGCACNSVSPSGPGLLLPLLLMLMLWSRRRQCRG